MHARSTSQSQLLEGAKNWVRHATGGWTKIQTGSPQFTHFLRSLPKDQLNDEVRKWIEADDAIKAEQKKAGC